MAGRPSRWALAHISSYLVSWTHLLSKFCSNVKVVPLSASGTVIMQGCFAKCRQSKH